MSVKVGFIGLGDMGMPMALRLLDAGTNLAVWTRDSQKLKRFQDTSAVVATSPEDIFAQSDVVILMLASADAVDTVLQRGTAGFPTNCNDRVIVQMGTTLPAYSKTLEADILAAGGRYAEVPLSGSSVPAASGQLVAMQAGDPETLAEIEAVIAPLISAKVDCGAIPAALQMKLAVNTCLAGVMFGLLEGTNLARQCGLDMQVFRQVMEAGQMASPVVKMKMPKLVDEDFSPQASVYQTGANLRMMHGAAEEVGAQTPLVDSALGMQEKAIEMGFANDDVCAVIRAYQDLNSV
ncbi:MAG: NAD(P)-dependent oxidoreductase [Paracoccaceae bacterium]|nr:NAD(P)-dependent oxidoreductase [Paracoccaceae bacterium]MDG1739611.1 NAD(P)-dependent oxidoreductase [Paracoccaceae bacterium]MDG2258137.1 NAD(P)-dependent oxidoreductase [Paracoccaceae bacterium]